MNQKLKSILSILCIIIILGLLIGTVVFAIQGDPRFMGMLALTFFFPIIVWAIVHFDKVFKNDK